MEQTTPRRLDISQKKLQPELRAQPPWPRLGTQQRRENKKGKTSSTRNNVADWKWATAWPERKLEGGDAQKLLHTQGLLRREVFTQRSFLHTEGFAQRSLYSKELLHTNVLEFLNTKSVTLGSLYTKIFNTQTRLHTETFAQRSLYAESFYTRKLLHTEKILNRRAFTQRSFHTQKEAFTKEVFTQRKLLHTKAFTQRSLSTEAPLHEVTSWNWQQFFRKNPSQELSGTHLLPKNRLFPTNMFQKT